MKSQSEEFLWIAAQEDQLIPFEMVQFAVKKHIPLLELLEYDGTDFEGISSKAIGSFLTKREVIDVSKYQQIWDRAQDERVCLITYDDPSFPQNLKDLESNKTVLLYHMGLDIPLTNCVAIVGTRNCSTYAAEFTRELSRKVAQNGHIVVAGLARGIDAYAHRGAISVGGKTIAVLPWMFNPYPMEHGCLLNEVTKNGAAISEIFFTTRGQLNKARFVFRNAIISGISDVLVAVESSTTGGTIWQVEIARKQNRPVIAIEPEPDNVDAYRGFEKFVDMGAMPAKSIEQTLQLIEKNMPKKEQKSETKLLSEFS
ncbi:MAG: DNA-processing protein DprA [Nitrosotalea sp.]